jgi:hypothetical protein
MHQSPQKHLARRRDKYNDIDTTESQPDRLRYRESQPKARKFHLREESGERDARWDKQGPDK